MFPTMTPSGRLEAYKEAVREELTGAEPLTWKEFQLTFYFWRKLEAHLTTESGKKVRRHQVDATNMQKALEDALQGVILDNDRDVRRIESVIVEQSMDCETPRIIIRADEWTGFDPDELVHDAWQMIVQRDAEARANKLMTGWRPPEVLDF